MSDNIEKLNQWLNQFSLSLSPSERKELMRRLASGLRLRMRNRIKSQKDPSGAAFVPRKRQQIGAKKKGAMFLKIGRFAKTDYSANHATVGFAGAVAKVAEAHQYGKTQKPSSFAKPYSYPVRELVGFSDEDVKWVEQMCYDFLAVSQEA